MEIHSTSESYLIHDAYLCVLCSVPDDRHSYRIQSEYRILVLLKFGGYFFNPSNNNISEI